VKTDNNPLHTAWNDYSRKLLSFIRAKVDSREDAEDILADVFVKLAKQFGSAGTPSKLSSWLYVATRNSIIDYYRTRRPMEELPEDLRQERPDPQAISALSACIVPVIEQLPDTYRLPILLAEIQGQTQKEVAETLGLTLPAVKSRILRGRNKLKDILAKRCTLYYDQGGQLIDFKEKNSTAR